MELLTGAVAVISEEIDLATGRDQTGWTGSVRAEVLVLDLMRVGQRTVGLPKFRAVDVVGSCKECLAARRRVIVAAGWILKRSGRILRGIDVRRERRRRSI